MIKNNIKNFIINNILLLLWSLLTILIEISSYLYYRISDLKIGESSNINLRNFLGDEILLKKGQILSVKLHDEISSVIFDNKLKYFAVFIIFYISFFVFTRFVKTSNFKLFLLITISIVLTAISKVLNTFWDVSVFSIPIIPLIGFLLVFYEKKVLLPFIFIVSFLISIPYGISIAVIFPLVVSSCFSLILFKKGDKKMDYFIPAVLSSLFLLFVLILFSILRSKSLDSSILESLITVSWSMLGIAAFYVLLQILKMYTSVFTNNNLIEYLNLDHPLLKKLKTEAPGTYQHSLAMANLAETAANDIGANGILCRVGAYFHDIGKTHSPEYFTENQQEGESPHNSITPQESAEVIMEHVSYGMELAKKYKLPKFITQFITTHHGTTVLEFFYDKALNSGLDVTPNDFRYPGNKPENKETALLMIVDSVEAASRSLDDASPEKLENLISNIVFKKLLLNQLSKSGLSITELRSVILSLLESLKNNSHSRIKYPWQKKEEGMTTSQVVKKEVISQNIENNQDTQVEQVQNTNQADLNQETDNQELAIQKIVNQINQGTDNQELDIQEIVSQIQNKNQTISGEQNITQQVQKQTLDNQTQNNQDSSKPEPQE